MAKWFALAGGRAGRGRRCSSAGDKPGAANRRSAGRGHAGEDCTGTTSAGVNGEGWKIATGEILAGPDDTDFHLTMAMVISLFPSQGSSGFCQKQPAAGAPAFARVEDVPGDDASCATWSTGYLGGNTEHADSLYAGQGFLVRLLCWRRGGEAADGRGQHQRGRRERHVRHHRAAMTRAAFAAVLTSVAAGCSGGTLVADAGDVAIDRGRRPSTPRLAMSIPRAPRRLPPAVGRWASPSTARTCTGRTCRPTR